MPECKNQIETLIDLFKNSFGIKTLDDLSVELLEISKNRWPNEVTFGIRNSPLDILIVVTVADVLAALEPWLNFGMIRTFIHVAQGK